MAKRSTQCNAITVVEAVVVLVVCGGLLLLLIPALASSRESARQNYCRKNLKRLDLATETIGLSGSVAYVPASGPFGDGWPIKLLPEHAKGNPLRHPRPKSLTCPSRPLDSDSGPLKQTCHYVALVNDGIWTFSDRELDMKIRAPWAVGVRQDTPPWLMPSQKGPHAGGTFLYTDGKGNVKVAAPLSADE